MSGITRRCSNVDEECAHIFNWNKTRRHNLEEDTEQQQRNSHAACHPYLAVQQTTDEVAVML